MRITKWVDCSQQMEIDIGPQDISVIFTDNPDDVKEWVRQVNDIATFMIGTPTKTLEKLTKKQVEMIGRFFREQGERIEQYMAT
jgi:hypothetical protein